jgi:hypothetical protein
MILKVSSEHQTISEVVTRGLARMRDRQDQGPARTGKRKGRGHKRAKVHPRAKYFATACVEQLSLGGRCFALSCQTRTVGETSV